MKKLSTTVYLTAEQVIQLKEASEKISVPQSVIIRQGIDVILKEILKPEARLALKARVNEERKSLVKDSLERLLVRFAK